MKRISKVKEDILGLLWEVQKPVGLKDVSQEMGLKARSANMHLLGLAKSGFVSKSAKGLYKITDSGRESIGFPKINKRFAKEVLGKTPAERCFHFYSGFDRPMGIFSDSLVDLSEKIKTLSTEPIEFHLSRGDFENWVSSLGDIELARRLRLIQERDLAGEALRERLHKTIRSRCEQLLKK